MFYELEWQVSASRTSGVYNVYSIIDFHASLLEEPPQGFHGSSFEFHLEGDFSWLWGHPQKQNKLKSTLYSTYEFKDFPQFQFSFITLASSIGLGIQSHYDVCYAIMVLQLDITTKFGIYHDSIITMLHISTVKVFGFHVWFYDSYYVMNFLCYAIINTFKT